MVFKGLIMSEEKLTNRILLIDDDEMINQVLTSILTKEFEVENYFNAEEALSKVDFSRYDVVLTDVNLPGISGIDFLSKVKLKEPNLPVIVITGMSYIDVAISALKKGAADFIQKPFYNDQIILAVKKAQERRKLILENLQLVSELTDKNIKLEELNKQTKRRNEQIEHDLDIASNLQACLFPATFPEIDKFSFCQKFKPIEKISGDFFEVIEDDAAAFSLVLADVSGHGVPAAFFSAMVKTAISSLDKSIESPAKKLEIMNEFLIQSQKKLSYNYVTLCYIYFDISNNKIIYSNAGIPAPVMIKKNGRIVKLMQNGPFVGIFEQAEYIDAELPLDDGDKIIMFTDGAYESYNEDDISEGYQIVYDMINKIKDESIERITEALFLNIEEQGKETYDDITILGIGYNKKNKS